MSEQRIGIIMGSKSDWPLVEKAIKSYSRLDLPLAVTVASAHRTPEIVEQWVKDAEKQGVEVIIAVAGMSAALPGVVASQTLLPVIGVPVESGALRGEDALYSIAQMPPGIPVGSMGINGIKNALLYAVHILSLKYPAYKKKLQEFRASEKRKIPEAQKEIHADYPSFSLGERVTPETKTKKPGKKKA